MIAQWVPDGSGITPFSLGDGTIVYGHRTASGEVYDEFGNLLGHI